VSAARGSGLAQVQYRRNGGFGRGLGVGLGIGVLGAIIANEAYRPRAGYYYDDYAYDGPYEEPADFAGDPRNLCAQRFRSFEWNTGLYTAYSGEKRVCPYLR
jgi:outer membrane receptor protein involved in Fe transport